MDGIPQAQRMFGRADTHAHKMRETSGIIRIRSSQHGRECVCVESPCVRDNASVWRRRRQPLRNGIHILTCPFLCVRVCLRCAASCSDCENLFEYA